ncbi:unnamed protein product [Prunus armeniaca]
MDQATARVFSERCDPSPSPWNVTNNKSKHGNETSVDTGTSGSTGSMPTESTADTHQAVNISSVDFNGVW